MDLVASRYAESFFSLGLDKKCVEEYKNDLKQVKNIFDDVENIKTFFLSERITKDEKKDLIRNTLANSIKRDTLNFLLLLVDKGRIGKYSEIIVAYNKLANNELNIKEGVIESVRPLDEAKIKELEEALSKDDMKVELKQKINKSLISGFKISFDNEVIDASMKDKIDKLHNMLSRKDV